MERQHCRTRPTSTVMTVPPLGLALVLTVVAGFVSVVHACQVCYGNSAALLPPSIHQRHNNRNKPFATLDNSLLFKQTAPSQQQPLLFVKVVPIKAPCRPIFMTTNSDDENENLQRENAGQPENEETPKADADDGMSTAMIASIGFYKKVISPLLPPACRFVPTCSQYGIQAIKEFGADKGAILIAWRLLRCSPFGGKGYDPPKWPPVSYTYSSY